ncbi:MAG: protein kinase domain-containing protein [Gemmatimonadaceae bacterium]
MSNDDSRAPRTAFQASRPMVEADRWRRIEEVLDAALACEPEQWDAVLDTRCGVDARLRADVEEYLGRVSAAEHFLSSPPSALAARLVVDGHEAVSGNRYVGRRIGSYRVVRQIGRGGMARVFLAERADGQFAQHVALKLLRPGFDSDIDVERFRAERQILASLSHPNIARLYDGGVTDDDLPFLVLEYVEGEPIDRYCETYSLSARARLDLFLEVTDAVQYAHDRSIVHRDLKPSNILVSADGAVKLLDFGLARMLEEGVTGEAPPTRTGQRWMTPEYAAPEQVRGSVITSRTDVYQLGAVLYELLSGHTPFASRAGTLHELEMAALDQDPEPLGGACRGDLDAIVLKALRKQPEDRYATAGDLAADIRRHLTGHPVRARRPTPGYRTRRFVARHRVRLAAAVIVVLVAAASVSAVAAERSRARRAESAATLVGQLRALPAIIGDGRRRDAQRLVSRAIAAARNLSIPAESRAQLLEAAGGAMVGLGERQAGFELLQQGLVIRRQRGGSPSVDSASPLAMQVARYSRHAMRRGMLFSRPGSIFMMDLDGTHEIPIANNLESWSANPSWAHDGKRVLFSRAVGDSRAIFITTADGSRFTQLTAPPAAWKDELPVALGETRVAFLRSSPSGDARICAVKLDGSGFSEITPGPHDGDPTPFPAGDRFAYVSNGDIYVWSLRTGERTRLTQNPKQYKAGLAVSPDGEQLAFTRIDPDRLEQIFVMAVDGTDVRRVSRGNYYDFLPRWSPDGTRIGFTSSRDGSLGIYSMRLDGSDVIDLSRTPGRLIMRPGISVLQVTETLWAWAKY